MNKNPRIESLAIPFHELVWKMSDGNPGAATVMMTIMENEDIDPDAAMGGIGTILSLDTHGIYGPRIWMLYKDVCKQNISHMLALLRAVQLGYCSEGALNKAIDNYGEGLNQPELIAKVKERLPAFKIEDK